MDQLHKLLYTSTTGLSEFNLLEMRNECCFWISLGAPDVIDADLHMRHAQIELELQVIQEKRIGVGL
jgi:hypothetical protein